MEQYEISSLKKGLLIVDLLKEHVDLSLTEIMKQLQLSKTTAFRLLWTLEAMDYVKKDQNLYRLTNKAIGQSFNAQMNWLFVPPLHKLSVETKETVYVGILSDTNVVTAQVVHAEHLGKTRTKIGDSEPAHMSALGKAILSNLDDRELSQILSRLQLTKQAKNTFHDPHLLKEHLKVIRSSGYAIDDEEAETGLRCIAAPIFRNEKVIAAVALSGSATRLSRKMDKQLSKKVIACSRQITTIL